MGTRKDGFGFKMLSLRCLQFLKVDLSKCKLKLRTTGRVKITHLTIICTGGLSEAPGIGEIEERGCKGGRTLGNTTIWGLTRELKVRKVNRKGSLIVQGKSGPRGQRN